MDDGQWRENLRRWYSSSPGATHELTHRYLTSRGCNTYEFLAQTLDQLSNESPRVLDLGCGGGNLYQYCEKRVGAEHWIGIDFVQAQIEAARQQYPGVDFRCESAGALSVPDACVDAVLCHLALGEMTELDAVIDEVERVLRPGGLFAALVQAKTSTSAEWPDDPRAHTGHGLVSLFDAPFEAATIGDYSLIIEDTVENIWSLVSQRSYQIGMLSEEEKELRRAETMAHFRQLAQNGIRTMKVPGHRLTVRKRAA